MGQQWRPKPQIAQQDQQAVQPNTSVSDKFQMTNQGDKRKESVAITSIRNYFALLSEMENNEDIIVGNVVCGNGTKSKHVLDGYGRF